MRNHAFWRIGAVAAALFFAAIVVHSFRAAPAPAPRLDLPPVADVREPVPESPHAPAPGRGAQGPERLLPFLEALGRARLVKDRRTLADLRGRVPPVFEEDFEWIRARISGELFAAAGAAELAALFRRGDAVGDLAAALSGRASPLLKDIAIETLASLGGDGAAAALMGTARGDSDEGLRARAVSALGGFPGPEAYSTLAAALGDPSSVVRSAAAAALSRMPSRETVELLLGRLAGERDPSIQADLAVCAFACGGEPWRETVVRAILLRPEVLAEVQERRRVRDDSRYAVSYPKSFFEPGQPAVSRPPGRRRIGITVETGPGESLGGVAARLFAVAPLDRYREWFRLRRADEFPSLREYDSYGNESGESAYDELDGTVFLRFRDLKTFDPGVLGVTRGPEALVCDISLIHEFGHAFARLGDEYPDGSTADAANLAPPPSVPWEPLVRSGILPEAVRRDRAFLVPSADCHMANRPSPTRFCPVCQLEMHARMWDLARAPLPWGAAAK